MDEYYIFFCVLIDDIDDLVEYFCNAAGHIIFFFLYEFKMKNILLCA